MLNEALYAATNNNRQKEDKNQLVFSYLKLRNLIGFGGMLLPVILIVCSSCNFPYCKFQPSISDYYYTNCGDILAVLLCVIGTFLITYRGYTFWENMLSTLAGICGIGIAFVPTQMTCGDCEDCKNTLHSVHTGEGILKVTKVLQGWGFHYLFAGVFLSALAVMSLVYFTRRNKAISLRKERNRRTQKAKRNLVYIVCGWIMLASVVIMGIYLLYSHYTHFEFKSFPFIFVFEAIAVEAFGLSWITKGETLWPDGEHYLKKALRKVMGK